MLDTSMHPCASPRLWQDPRSRCRDATRPSLRDHSVGRFPRASRDHAQRLHYKEPPPLSRHEDDHLSLSICLPRAKNMKDPQTRPSCKFKHKIRAITPVRDAHQLVDLVLASSAWHQLSLIPAPIPERLFDVLHAAGVLDVLDLQPGPRGTCYPRCCEAGP